MTTVVKLSSDVGGVIIIVGGRLISVGLSLLLTRDSENHQGPLFVPGLAFVAFNSGEDENEEESVSE